MSHAEITVSGNNAKVTRQITFKPMPDEKRKRIIEREIRKLQRQGFELKSVVIW